MTTVGVISDTHGLLRPEALSALAGSELILHIGDIGREDILSSLTNIAPLHVVRGNTDRAPWCEAIPYTEVVEIEGHPLYLIHILQDLDLDPVAAGFKAVLSGHSHKPHMEWKNDILYLNPGSAGPRRFSLPITVAKLHITSTDIQAEIISLT